MKSKLKLFDGNRPAEARVHAKRNVVRDQVRDSQQADKDLAYEREQAKRKEQEMDEAYEEFVRTSPAPGK